MRTRRPRSITHSKILSVNNILRAIRLLRSYVLNYRANYARANSKLFLQTIFPLKVLPAWNQKGIPRPASYPYSMSAVLVLNIEY